MTYGSMHYTKKIKKGKAGMVKRSFLEEIYNKSFNNELEKISAKSCPGDKIKSKGKGRGLGYGQEKGPIGVPIKNKEKILEDLQKRTREF